MLNSSSNAIFKANPLRYRGYYYDTETGFYYLGSRYYDPAIKRFINADSANLITDNAYGLANKNLFSYCDGNPVMYSDSGGEVSELAIAAIVGGVAGAFWGGITNVAAGGSFAEGALWGGVAGAATGFMACFSAATTTLKCVSAVASAVIGGATSSMAYLATASPQTGSGLFAATVIGATNGAISGLLGYTTGSIGNAGNAVATYMVSGVSSAGTMISSAITSSVQPHKKSSPTPKTVPKRQSIKNRAVIKKNRTATHFRSSRSILY